MSEENKTVETEVPVKRKVGRPKKAVDPNAPVQEKRKPGRPKGSKNKPKAVAPTFIEPVENVPSFDDSPGVVVGSLFQEEVAEVDNGNEEVVQHSGHVQLPGSAGDLFQDTNDTHTVSVEKEQDQQEDKAPWE